MKKTAAIRLFIKRSARAALAIVFFLGYILVFPSPKPLYEIKGIGITGGAEVLLYTKDKAENSVFTGDFYRLRMTVKDLKSTKEIPAYSYITLKCGAQAAVVLKVLDVRIKETQQIAGGVLYTGSSALVDAQREKTGVNIQVFFKDGVSLVGAPAIYGSY